MFALPFGEFLISNALLFSIQIPIFVKNKHEGTSIGKRRSRIHLLSPNGKKPQQPQLFIAPGNAGTAAFGTNLAVSPTDFEGLKQAAITHQIELVIVGPEVPLVEGVVDFFKNDQALSHIPVIGPSKQGAELEGSKEFAKAFMQRHNIPTAAYQSFTKDTLSEGLTYLETVVPPYVLKADGLAAGKGSGDSQRSCRC